MHKRNNTKIQ